MHMILFCEMNLFANFQYILYDSIATFNSIQFINSMTSKIRWQVHGFLHFFFSFFFLFFFGWFCFKFVCMYSFQFFSWLAYAQMLWWIFLPPICHVLYTTFLYVIWFYLWNSCTGYQVCGRWFSRWRLIDWILWTF